VAYDKDLLGAIAVTRVGLGARGDEIAQASADPQGWLLAQIRPGGADLFRTDMPSVPERLAEYRQIQLARRQTQMSPGTATQAPAPDVVQEVRRLIRENAGQDILNRLQLAAATDAPFRERWALFWANHFTVSGVKGITANLIGPFEQEAIRPRVFGRFEDLLVASSSHPAMLLYLDQAQSIGPDSPAAARAGRNGRHVGLNENLAREILELHTVGVEAGYSQADVTEFARAMTGWSVGAERGGEDHEGRFVFRDNSHEPGDRVIMGRRYEDGGYDQARAVMRDLAASPHTAHHLAAKIARHFVADDPPPSLTARLADAYMDSRGDLSVVARSLIRAPETWAAQAQKFKTPYEFMVSSWRAAGTSPGEIARVAPVMASMGMRTFAAPSPKGWPDDTASWAAPDGIIKRMAWSETFSTAAVGERDPVTLAQNALGARLSPLAAKTIARAETRAEGLSILLMSPEFQRR